MDHLDHQKYMSLALAQAKIAWDLGEIPVGAVIVDDKGKVISTATNRTVIDSNPCAHAEILALSKAGLYINNYRLNDLSLYVTLEPCSMCVGALIHARIKNVIYGASDPKTGACGGALDLANASCHNHKFNIIAGVMQEECSTLLKDFFKMRRSLQKSGHDWIVARGMCRFWEHKDKN